MLMHIRGLTVSYPAVGGWLGGRRRSVTVLEDLDLELAEGETLGVVGESGSGKTTLANALLGLVPVERGEVSFQGADLLRLRAKMVRRVTREIQIVFQNPYSALNPRLRVFDAVAEPLRAHREAAPTEIDEHVPHLLREVGLTPEFLDRHPHELSGGQAQRVVLARALALNPKLLVLDEPTAALDISVQAQILNLLRRLQREHGLAYLFISHDLSVVQHLSDRIAVMYLGQVVESGPAEEIFGHPQHPYTIELLEAVPTLHPERRTSQDTLPATVPSPAYPPTGCRFHPRCPLVEERCRREQPALATFQNREARCHLLTEAG